MNLFPEIEQLRTNLPGLSRVPDFVIRVNNNFLRVIEAKYTLPIRGPAFDRMMLQLIQFQQYVATQGLGAQLLVWSLKDPGVNYPKFANAAIAAGVNVGQIQMVYGVQGLYSYFRLLVG